MSTQIMKQIERTLRNGPGGQGPLVSVADHARQLSVDELSYLIQATSPTESAELFQALDAETRLRVFQDLAPAYQGKLLSVLQGQDINSLVEALAPDDRASLLDELPAAVREELLTSLSADQRQMTALVLGYPRTAIGRYMSPAVLGLDENFTAGQALEYLRSRIREPETVYLLPVIDQDRKLTGVIGIRYLLGAEPGDRLAQISDVPISARADEDRREVARRFMKHKLVAMPITDADGRLVGMLTNDDASAILDEAAARSAARSGSSELISRSYLSTSVLRIVRSRIVWLVVLALSAVLTVQVLEIFEDRLDQVVALALFIPLLTGTGGNTGNQAATTVTRALAVGDVRLRDLPRVIWRELRVGTILGAALGSLGFAVASLVYGMDIGAVIGLTLLSICVMAACVGGLMPLLAKKIGADPAVFSNPFISTFCDATGLLIYFSIATAVLGLN
ncbi:magnesium transporter [Glutamicibacter creatinolyticus]|uniref:magnesium transporter n=2 Tax=Glutamicibacter creatinolyticus TaxID=162496 RepID=UPI0031CE30AE